MELARLADRLAQVVRLHRADLHLQDNNRPCPTCSESRKALDAYDAYVEKLRAAIKAEVLPPLAPVEGLPENPDDLLTPEEHAALTELLAEIAKRVHRG